MEQHSHNFRKRRQPKKNFRCLTQNFVSFDFLKFTEFSVFRKLLNFLENFPGNQFRDMCAFSGGFHATQVTLIITQVKNKIAYHSINSVKKLKYRRKVINKQRAIVSWLNDISNSSDSAKGITEK